MKKILMILAVVAAVFVIVVASRSPEFRVSRSALMAASPAAVFAQVNDLHKWEAWSPWAKLDPQAKVSYQGPAAGVGAAFHWAGNMEVGEGTMTISESRPSEYIRFQLDFLKPMPGTSTSEFTFQPQGKETRVIWTMFGKNNFIAKAMSLFMDCDKMIGGNFEKGLNDLKAMVEKKR